MRSRRTPRAYRPGKMMLGEHYTAAREKAMRFFKSEAAAVVHNTASRQEILDGCLLPETQRILRKAYNVVATLGADVDIAVIPNRVNLRIHFDSLGLARPVDRLMNPFPPTHPIVEQARKLAEIRGKWVRVAALIDWFDRVATPGAVRHLWPALNLLAPEHEGLASASLGAHYIDPPGYSMWLPYIREAATTVAAAAMLPAVELESYSSPFKFYLPAATHTIHGDDVTWGGWQMPIR